MPASQISFSKYSGNPSLGRRGTNNSTANDRRAGSQEAGEGVQGILTTGQKKPNEVYGKKPERGVSYFFDLTRLEELIQWLKGIPATTDIKSAGAQLAAKQTAPKSGQPQYNTTS